MFRFIFAAQRHNKMSCHVSLFIFKFSACPSLSGKKLKDYIPIIFPIRPNVIRNIMLSFLPLVIPAKAGIQLAPPVPTCVIPSTRHTAAGRYPVCAFGTNLCHSFHSSYRRRAVSSWHHRCQLVSFGFITQVCFRKLDPGLRRDDDRTKRDDDLWCRQDDDRTVFSHAYAWGAHMGRRNRILSPPRLAHFRSPSTPPGEGKNGSSLINLRQPQTPPRERRRGRGRSTRSGAHSGSHNRRPNCACRGRPKRPQIQGNIYHWSGPQRLMPRHLHQPPSYGTNTGYNWTADYSHHPSFQPDLAPNSTLPGSPHLIHCILLDVRSHNYLAPQPKYILIRHTQSPAAPMTLDL